MQSVAGSTNPDGDGERHPAVIVFADVVGYSRLMADDEPGTLNRWTALYKDVLKPEAERRGGQVGDVRGMRKRPESLTAYDCILRSVHLLNSSDRAISERARQYLEEAMLEDPTFALPAAIALEPSNALALSAKGHLLSYLEARARAQHALLLSLQDQSRYLYLAEARAIAGDLVRLEPEFRLATFARQRQPFRQPETGAAYLDGLRAAGLPD